MKNQYQLDYIKFKKIYFLDGSFISIINNYDIESCFNEEKDNGEEGFDCGGPCRRKCVGMIILIICLYSSFLWIYVWVHFGTT